MSTFAKAIHRSLLLRFAGVAALFATLCGVVTYLYQRGQVNQAITDQAGWGAELLRAKVENRMWASGRPWQAVAQEVLEERADQPLVSTLGQFVLVEVADSKGEPVAGKARGQVPDAVDRLPPWPADSAPSPQGIQLADSVTEAGRTLVPVSATVMGQDGGVVAYLRGLFEVSAETVTRLGQRAALGAAAIGLAVLLAAGTTYPVVRRLTGRLTSLSAELLDANLQSLRLLGSAIAKRDSHTDAHNYRVTVYSVRLAERVGLPGSQIRTLIKGAFLHDVGKIAVPDRLLLKPGPLDTEEFIEMRHHVTHGLDIVAESPWLRDAALVVGCHHEKHDGSGYHQGLSGAKIPVEARIFTIADVFDALTSERPYKQPLSLEQSLGILREGAGSQFDPGILDAFEGIAEPLHRKFAYGNDEAARLELEEIVDRYFRQDLSLILRDRRARSAEAWMASQGADASEPDAGGDLRRPPAA